ncbi:lysylphosphatidylglycerol synthase transmembrane domain-containing protein [Natronoglomus mannanivorans]|uniref:Flippase-like domain-containing protein n=1 Tax=Natronoglomus mannanivorans TaxID=2979990 RepID=A0AAP3E0T5_9EURY|nr:flippase-like domain-containing protein [Halobacteria archaeon AArc-xg1-1]
MNTTGVRLTTVVVGFVVATVVLSVLFALVGFEATLAAVAAADRFVLASLLVVVACWFGAWTYTLSVVFGILEVDHTPIDAVVLFGNVVFANSVAPSTYLGGEPLAALLLSRHTGRDYETSFAAVASVDLLNYAPMLPLAGVGLLYVVTTTVVGRTVELALAFVFLVLLALVVTVAVGWRRRDRVLTVVAAVLGGLSQQMDAVVPGVYAVAPAAFERRLGQFVANVERVAGDHHNLGLALGYSTAGWVLLSGVLWLALYAVGHAVEPEVVLFVVPLGAISNVLPLPGGLGTVEPIFVVLLVAMAGIAPPDAMAATLLYRGGTYWLPLLFGAGTVAAAHAPIPRPTE